MWLLFSILSAIFFALASFIVTIGTKRNFAISQMLLGLYISGSILFSGYLFINNGFEYSSKILFWGIIIGLGSSLGNALFSYALKIGPVSLTAPLVNTNVILVVLMSVLYFNEVITYTQIIAISLLVSACIILPFDPSEDKTVNSKPWYIVIIFTIIFMFLLNGGLKITQELNLNNTLVLLYAYLFSIIFFLLSIKYFARSDNNTSNTRIIWQTKAIYIGLFAGIFSFMGLQFYTEALLLGPASIVVPIFSSRNVIVAMLCIWFFKEPLSLFQKIALTSLLSGLCLVNF